MFVRGAMYLKQFYTRKLNSLYTMSKRSEIFGCITIYGFLVCQPPYLQKEIIRSNFLKYFVILLLVCNMLITTAYNSRLSSIMVAPIYENDINTLKELAESDLELLFFDEYYGPLYHDTRVSLRNIRMLTYYPWIIFKI